MFRLCFSGIEVLMLSCWTVVLFLSLHTRCLLPRYRPLWCSYVYGRLPLRLSRFSLSDFMMLSIFIISCYLFNQDIILMLFETLTNLFMAFIFFWLLHLVTIPWLSKTLTIALFILFFKFKFYSYHLHLDNSIWKLWFIGVIGYLIYKLFNYMK